MFKNKRILVLAPHTDDGELGCGGTIAKCLEAGSQVFYAAFSTADGSLPPHFPKNQLATEVSKATAILGIPADNLLLFNYQVRKLNYVRQEILDELIRLRPLLKPDIVFLPSSKDIHQDHLTIHQEGVRALKQCTIFGYELIWNNLGFHTDCFVELTEAQLNLKIKALSAYESQKERAYLNPEFIRSMAVVRGVQIGVRYAEAFEVVRLLV